MQYCDILDIHKDGSIQVARFLVHFTAYIRRGEPTSWQEGFEYKVTIMAAAQCHFQITSVSLTYTITAYQCKIL